MSAVATVKKWVSAFNEGNADKLSALYAEDAINHQVTQDPVKGRENIPAMFVAEFKVAEMTCIIEDIHDADEVAILEWRDPLGLRGCGFFTINNDLIVFQRGYWDKLSFLKLHNLPID